MSALFYKYQKVRDGHYAAEDRSAIYAKMVLAAGDCAEMPADMPKGMQDHLRSLSAQAGK
jgi:hypothetical protein